MPRPWWKRTVLLTLALASPLWGQAHAPANNPDTSGNSKLSGAYTFRHVLYVLAATPDADGIIGDIGEQVAFYGTITFDGNGNYVIADGMVWDSTLGFADPLSCYLAQNICASGVPVDGTYSISASGFGTIVNPLTEDLIYGLVAGNGTFTGSSTESTLAYSDLFIGVPAASTLPDNTTFRGSYSVAGYIPAESPISSANVFFQMNADGAGNLGTVNVTGNNGAAPDAILQSSTVTYSFDGGVATLNFPADAAAPFYPAPETVTFSPEGAFFFGGSPTGADMMIGVRNPANPQNFAGLFYQAGIDQNVSQTDAGTTDLDGYYGSFVATSEGNIVDHQRVSDSDLGRQSITFADSFANPVTGPFVGAAGSQQFAVSDGGAIRIGQDAFPLIGISIAVQAPVFGKAAQVYLNPAAIVNAATFAPFTAGISPGELLSLYGVNLSPNPAVILAPPYPPALGGVQVTIDGIPAPIYAVSQGQLSVVVPFEVSGSVASIQVVNNGVPSNIVTEPVYETTPGIFTAMSDGLGYAAVLHGADGTPVSASNPAQPNESVSVYLTGLGDVSPAPQDGAAPDSLSYTSDAIAVAIGGVPATVGFAGLAPGLAGVYQVNFRIPATAAPGDNVLAISGPDSSAMEALIPIASGAAALNRHVTPEAARVRSGIRVTRKPFCLFPAAASCAALPRKAQ